MYLSVQVLPTAVALANPNRTSIPNIILANSGSQRFDLLKGPFTKNDQFIVSPFDDKFLYFTAPFSIAKQILTELNKGPAAKRSLHHVERDPYARVGPTRFDQWKREQWERAVEDRAELDRRADLTLGYVTKDVSRRVYLCIRDSTGLKFL